MIAEDKIESALTKIEQLFVDQSAHGTQNANIAPTGAACGQFLGSPANSQRGLHGTAAALRVISQATTPEAAALVPRLIWYIENRDTLISSGRELPAGNHAFTDDQDNIIKLSEILYALSFVQASQSSTDNLVQSIATRLMSARKEDKGWSNFTDAQGPVASLPTAFAILALSRHGQVYQQQITKQIAYLESIVYEDIRPGSPNFDDTSVKIFCVFALAFRKDNLPQAEIKKLRNVFDRLWRTHVRLLDHDIEQNIEYSRGPSNYYIRVPWQLYLLALAARLESRYISGLAAQRGINRIADSVLGIGFKYPYSGSVLSSRTNAILYDVLQKIRQFNQRNFFHSLYYAYDRVRTVLSHPFFSYCTLLIWLGVAGFCTYKWIAKHGKPEDIGSDFASALVIMFITFFVERLRKPR